MGGRLSGRLCFSPLDTCPQKRSTDIEQCSDPIGCEVIQARIPIWNEELMTFVDNAVGDRYENAENQMVLCKQGESILKLDGTVG